MNMHFDKIYFYSVNQLFYLLIYCYLLFYFGF